MTTLIPTTITSQYNLNTPNMTYALTGNTTVTTTTAPFNVTAGGILFDGRGYTITINGITNFLGLFNAALTVQNLSLDATGTYSLNRGTGGGNDPSQDASWFMKFGISTPTIISNCTNYANLDPRGSAFFGGSTSNCTAISCTNKCPSRQGDAAIFGTNASNCTASNCVSTSPVRSGAGAAIFGSSSVDCTAINCACLEGGTIGGYGAGIFSFTSLRGTASNCLNRTQIVGSTPIFVAGGIFAGPCYSGSAINCYNSGAVSATAGNLAYAIIGADAYTASATNCYTTNGTIAPAVGVTQTNCYTDPNTAWRDSNASQYLIGGPVSTAVYPAAGSVWYSTALNTPYFLVSLLNIPCFLAGARILTPTGYRRVETLADNDEVTTSDGRSVPVKIFKTYVAKTDEDTAPFVIEKGAISYNVPDEDLHLSGAHVIQDARGVWQIPAGLATHPGSRVYQHLPGRAATYYHVECPNFFTDDLVANNCVVESFRNQQGTSENSYTYDIDLGGFVRIMEDDEHKERLFEEVISS